MTTSKDNPRLFQIYAGWYSKILLNKKAYAIFTKKCRQNYLYFMYTIMQYKFLLEHFVNSLSKKAYGVKNYGIHFCSKCHRLGEHFTKTYSFLHLLPHVKFLSLLGWMEFFHVIIPTGSCISKSCFSGNFSAL